MAADLPAKEITLAKDLIPIILYFSEEQPSRGFTEIAAGIWLKVDNAAILAAGHHLNQEVLALAIDLAQAFP